MVTYVLFSLISIGVIFIVAEIRRPRVSKRQKLKYNKISERYRKSGYTTYFTSIHTPEFFFVYADKGKDNNDGKRYCERIYIDCEREEAFISRSVKNHNREYIKPLIPFDTI